MGLTGGIADVGSLYECLAGIHQGRADDAILDTYCAERRRIWHEQINPISSVNMERLFSIDADEIVDKDPFIGMVRKMERGEFQPPPGPVSFLPERLSDISSQLPNTSLFVSSNLFSLPHPGRVRPWRYGTT